MLLDLRNDLGLTRQELSDLTGRSLNYLLKAEQLSFPSAPAPLIDFYAKTLAMPPDVIRSAYREAQFHQRMELFNHVVPRPLTTVNFSFCRKWLLTSELSATSETSELGEAFQVSPSQYAMSKWLCVPASAVYFAEHNPHKPLAQSITDALSDVEKAFSDGRLYNNFPTYEEALTVRTHFERILDEYGIR